MADQRNHLGALVSVHGTSPVFLQRAAIVAIVSFLFFLTTLLFFYMQQAVGYFVLSTAFLVVCVFTMIGWVLQKRKTVSLFEKGISYRSFSTTWDELQSVKVDSKTGIKLVKTGGDAVTIPETVSDLQQIATAIRSGITQ
jgi:hypothetical protein